MIAGVIHPDNEGGESWIYLGNLHVPGLGKLFTTGGPVYRHDLCRHSNSNLGIPFPSPAYLVCPVRRLPECRIPDLLVMWLFYLLVMWLFYLAIMNSG